LERVYGDVWRRVPVCLATVPFAVGYPRVGIPESDWHSGRQFPLEQNEALQVKVGCNVYDVSPDDRVISLPDSNEVRLDELFYRIHGVRSGRHHPDGCFWVQSTYPSQVREKVPLTAILQLFDVDAPPYMKEPPVRLAELDH
jgi:hypothetical protein